MTSTNLSRIAAITIAVLLTSCSAGLDTERVTIPFARRPALLVDSPVTLHGNTVGIVERVLDTWPGVSVVLRVKRDALPRHAVFFVTSPGGQSEVIVYPLSVPPRANAVYAGTESIVELAWLRSTAATRTGLLDVQRWLDRALGDAASRW